jgi:hypothetical protein
MVILRATHKLRRALPLSRNVAGESTTALGDWYVNRMVVDRRALLILVSSKSLLSILTPARGAATLPSRLPELVGARLRRHGVAPELIEAEVTAMSPVVVAATVDRSVVGFMVDFAFTIPYHLNRGAWDETTLPFIEASLARTPCHSSRRLSEVIWPDRKARELLTAHWGSI